MDDVSKPDNLYSGTKEASDVHMSVKRIYTVKNIREIVKRSAKRALKAYKNPITEG